MVSLGFIIELLYHVICIPLVQVYRVYIYIYIYIYIYRNFRGTRFSMIYLLESFCKKISRMVELIVFKFESLKPTIDN